MVLTMAAWGSFTVASLLVMDARGLAEELLVAQPFVVVRRLAAEVAMQLGGFRRATW